MPYASHGTPCHAQHAPPACCTPLAANADTPADMYPHTTKHSAHGFCGITAYNRPGSAGSGRSADEAAAPAMRDGGTVVGRRGVVRTPARALAARLLLVQLVLGPPRPPRACGTAPRLSEGERPAGAQDRA